MEDKYSIVFESEDMNDVIFIDQALINNGISISKDMKFSSDEIARFNAVSILFAVVCFQDSYYLSTHIMKHQKLVAKIIDSEGNITKEISFKDVWESWKKLMGMDNDKSDKVDIFAKIIKEAM